MSFRRLHFGYATVIAVGSAFVFVAPWHSPGETAPAISDSYALGFDNHVAMVGVLACLAALIALSWRHLGADGPLVLDSAPPRNERVSTWLVTLLLAVTLASAMFFTWFALNAYGYGEKNYFLDRLTYVLAGWMPYRDFEFTYGPLLIYLPAWAAQALQPLGISAAGAYSLTWIATYASGVPLLAWCVNRLAFTRAQRNVTFAAIGIAVSFNESVGMNGLLLRFLMPVAALLALQTAASRAKGRWRVVLLTAATAACGLAGWAVSPELGIAVLAGAAAYLAATAMGEPRVLASLLGLVVAPLVEWALFGAAPLRQLFGMAGGALNFPVVPGPPMIVLLGGGVIVAALLPRHLGHGRPGAAAALALGIASGTMLIGALGRADSSHAYFYGIPVALLAFATLARRSSRVFAAFALAYGVVFLSAHVIALSEDYGAALVEAAVSRPELTYLQVLSIANFFGVDAGMIKTMVIRAARFSHPDATPFERYAPLAAPAGFRNGLGFALAARGWLAPAYFRGTPFTPAQLDVEIASLEPTRDLIVPDDYAEALRAARPADPPPETLGGFRYWALLMWPQRFPERHVQPDLSRRLMAWVGQRYHAVATIGGYTVLQRTK